MGRKKAQEAQSGELADSDGFKSRNPVNPVRGILFFAYFVHLCGKHLICRF
jgi:hypothetical protein